MNRQDSIASIVDAYFDGVYTGDTDALGTLFDLYLTLRLLNGKWSIVNKTFVNLATE